MNFELSEEEEAARDLARQIFSAATSFDRSREIEADRAGPGFDRALWAQLAQANLLGLPIREEFGGQGFSFVALCLVLEEAGRHLAPVPLLESIVQTALPLQQFGRGAFARDLLARTIAGESTLTAALFEIGAPALARRTKTSAVAHDDGFELNGEKVCVPWAGSAERMLVSASGQAGLGLFWVSPAASCVSLAVQETTAHERQFVVELAGVEVGAAEVLAAPGEGEAVLDWLEPRAVTALAAIALGAAEEGLRRTAEYTSTRKQFGREIGSFQGVSLRAADAYIDVEAMRSTMWQAAWRIDAGAPGIEKAAAVAKWWACMGGHRVSLTCQHLHGGIGSDVDYPIHRFFLRLKHVAMTLGGAGEQLEILGRRIAEEAIAGVSAEAILQ